MSRRPQEESIYTLHNFLMMGHPTFLFPGTLLGDMVFSLTLFGIYDWLSQSLAARAVPQLEPHVEAESSP